MFKLSYLKRTTIWDFLGGSVVKNPLPLQRAQFLIPHLRTKMPACTAAHKAKTKKHTKIQQLLSHSSVHSMNLIARFSWIPLPPGSLPNLQSSCQLGLQACQKHIGPQSTFKKKMMKNPSDTTCGCHQMLVVTLCNFQG